MSFARSHLAEEGRGMLRRLSRADTREADFICVYTRRGTRHEFTAARAAFATVVLDKT